MANIEMTFEKWFNVFLAEKNLPEEMWELSAPDGTCHIIGTETVIDHIRMAPARNQAEIRNILINIDFVNRDVNHFFRHLAQGFVNNF